MDELNKALRTSFIDKSFPSNKDLRPKLFFNDYKRRMNLAFEITKRLKECDYFEFSVAFISESGLAVLKQILLNLKEKGVKGRIITSTYLGFNAPKMFNEANVSSSKSVDCDCSLCIVHKIVSGSTSSPMDTKLLIP